MLSIGKLVAGAEEYYLNTVARGFEEYYTGAGEAPGHWLGSAAAELGLSGEIDGEHLAAVLRGRSPLDASVLTGRSVPSDKRVAGFDVTFSAPKSVSLLYGLGGAEIGEAVRAAHDDAVSDALCYLESHAAMTRRGAAGQAVATTGLVAAGFRHRTSRAGDPQLHTHVLVANAVRGNDGKWSSLHASLLYHHGRTAGFVYQAALRAGLVERLGVSFGPLSQGTAEIAGMPKQLIELFSKRRAEIVARLEEVGARSRRAAEIATLDTRKPKPAAGEKEAVTDLHEHWRAQARAQGIEPEMLSSLLGTPRIVDARGPTASIVEFLLGPGGLTHSASTFQRRDVIRGVAERLSDGGRLHEIEVIANAVMTSDQVVHLGVDGRGAEELSSTSDLLFMEATLIETATSSLGSTRCVVQSPTVDGVLAERPSISDEQAEMVRFVTSSGNGVDVVVGKAGAGKTFALNAARASWQRAGFRVRGTALSARAAAELESGAGIASVTLARLKGELEQGRSLLGPEDIIVIDEAGMVGTRNLHFVVDRVVSAGGKVVLTGDHRQLPEIEAGGGFRSLSMRIGAFELHENRRQVEGWERAALDELRSGDVGDALVAYGDHERLHLLDSAGAARAAMVARWAEVRAEKVDGRMYALRRNEVEELNTLARRELRRRGELGDDVICAGNRSFAENDEVLFLRNDGRLGVLNGTRGVVSGAGDDGLRVRTERGCVEVPYSYLAEGHLGHGYASTVHKAQGATVGRAFVLGGAAMYREAGYVSMSRAAAGTELFVVTSAFENGWTPVGAEDPLASFKEALTSSRAKRLALESTEKDPDLAPREETAFRHLVEGSTPSVPGRTPHSDGGFRTEARADVRVDGDSRAREPEAILRRNENPGDEAQHLVEHRSPLEFATGLWGRRPQTAAEGDLRCDPASLVAGENPVPRRGRSLSSANQLRQQSDTAAILELLGAFDEPLPERQHRRDLGRSR